ncbi:MAG: ABC transporter permease [Hyphomonadaceae bacterium]
MTPLDKKLLRDLWRMRIHVASVALVLGCGLAIFIMSLSLQDSLERTRAGYYADRRMADLAVSLVRAPDRVVRQLAELPGIEAVETRVTGLAVLNIAGMTEPASARLVSLPEHGRPAVNDLVVARGRWPDPSRPREALVNEAFASAHALAPGDRLEATIYGRRQTLSIVGIANSPEFVFVAAPGELFPQPARFGVIWMGREALARAFDLDGAFNEAVFRLGRNAAPNQASAAIDEMLRSYGSSGAYGRDRMISDRFLSEEISQLATMATFLPAFFLIIAAFLVNIALGRMIATERSNIGLLKSFGYTGGAIAWHYAKNALVFAVFGALLGWLGGQLLGAATADIYREYYRFPHLDFIVPPATIALAWLTAVATALLGALISVLRASRLAPAEALAPPRPAAFFSGPAELRSFTERLDAKSRIILRRIVRFPRRAGATSLGVAFAIALLVVAQSFPAVMKELLDVHFGLANRQHVTLTFAEAREAPVMHEVERLPGVIYAEPFRVEDVLFHHRGRDVQEAVFGVPFGARLSRVIGQNRDPIEPPASGIYLARALAGRLDAGAGDTVLIEQTRGRRTRASVRVAGIVDPMVGSSAYMELNTLSRLMRQPARISGAHARLDYARYRAFNERLKETPSLAGASFILLAAQSMRAQYDEGVGVMNFIFASFAAAMAGGVAFAAARITFAEQERDLATLRVLGFTRAEVSYVLIGELVLLAAAAIPAGCIMGLILAQALMESFETELYSFPFVCNPPGYAFAIAFTLLCVTVAALVVRRGVDKLDMVAVLKARD